MITGVIYVANSYPIVYYRKSNEFVPSIPYMRLLNNSFKKAANIYVKVGNDWKICMMNWSAYYTPLYDKDNKRIYDSEDNPIYIQLNEI